MIALAETHACFPFRMKVSVVDGSNARMIEPRDTLPFAVGFYAVIVGHGKPLAQCLFRLQFKISLQFML